MDSGLMVDELWMNVESMMDERCKDGESSMDE
jgi:hypothetical protein